MKKWIIRVFMFLILFNTIKNIQIILAVLFEYKETLLLIISYLLSFVIIILNCFSKSQDNSKQVNDKRNNV